METFPKDPFEPVKARIVSGDVRQVMGVLGEATGVELVEATELLFLDVRDWVAPGGEGSSEVGDVSVEVTRVVTNSMPSSRGE